MKYRAILLVLPVFVLPSILAARAEIKVLVDHIANDVATPHFRFKTVPAPSTTDTGAKAKFRIVDGQRDENGGELYVLNDGKAPSEEDQPEANFFFEAGTPGGRLALDLGTPLELGQINTYSWHPGSRAPQVYKLYGSDGKAGDFSEKPGKGTNPEKAGWKLIANVDTRPKEGDEGGQYGVNISDPTASMGSYRYLLFDIAQTENTDAFGNTFYSEIDVVAADQAEPAIASDNSLSPFVIYSPDRYCEITIDATGAPELSDWATNKLAPVLAEWYPKIVAALPSEGFSAPKAFRVVLRPGQGVAATGGTNVTANSKWLMNERHEINAEAVGALLHEEVHVVQQYGWGRRRNPEAKPSPGWLTEGIPDYIRWFQFEPQSHGADVPWLRARRNVSLRYDGKYRITANFLNYVVEKYDRSLITKLNAASRQGKYTDEIWTVNTGKTIDELNGEWKSATEKEIAAGDNASVPTLATQDVSAAESKVNALTESEKAAGWKLLFNGKDYSGWHNFKHEGVRPGWQVKDGALVCVDPHDAGDIVTPEMYGAFELQLDYNISEGGNSGIMYHVTEEGGAAWATGPEFQLEDNAKAKDTQRCGWLYALYQPEDDPNTGKPIDATKPAGEWNHLHLLVTPDKCEHVINGVKYFEYVLGSEDFKERVAKSKFGKMPLFAKASKGFIALQGDHGEISFRNIKVRSLD